MSHERLAKDKAHGDEWPWLGIATMGGALLGALILGAFAYWLRDDSGLFSRIGIAVLYAVVGAMVGAVAGFVPWALWVFLRESVRSFSHRP